MGYKEQILKILNGNKLTVKELAEKLNISESDIRVYIKRIKDDNNMNKLEVVGTEDKYKVYTLNKREQENDLIFLIELFESGKVKVYRPKMTIEDLNHLEAL